MHTNSHESDDVDKAVTPVSDNIRIIRETVNKFILQSLSSSAD